MGSAPSSGTTDCRQVLRLTAYCQGLALLGFVTVHRPCLWEAHLLPSLPDVALLCFRCLLCSLFSQIRRENFPVCFSQS